MEYLLMVAMTIFSIYAGVQAGKAFADEGNERKGFVLIGMWVVIFIAYMLAFLQLS